MPSLVGELRAYGVPDDLLARVLELESLEPLLARRKSADRLRQAAQRARNRKTSRDEAKASRDANDINVPRHVTRHVTDDVKARLQAFGEEWNALAASLRLPQIDEIKPGSTRERHALARLKETDDVDWLWPAISASPLLRGEVNGWRCNFDWVVNAANWIKIKDGNYEARKEKKLIFGR